MIAAAGRFSLTIHGQGRQDLVRLLEGPGEGS
jgi:hypothetical protein